MAQTDLGTGQAPLANQLNPDGLYPGLWTGLSPLSAYKPVSFSPSGIMYLTPWEWPKRKSLGESGWQYFAVAEGGYLANFGTNVDAAEFQEYADFGEGPLLNRFAFDAVNPETASYFTAYGGAVGRDDQYYEISFGQLGAFDVRAYFNGTPHTFATNAKVLWDGAGTGELTLPSGLTPGDNSTEAVEAALAQISESTLKLKRDKAGFEISYIPMKGLELFANANTEWRDGGRPFGGAFTYPFLGQVAETVEPVNYTTHELDAGLRYSSERILANLAYSGSFFRNDTESLTFDNPGLADFRGSFVAPRGRFALNPDNNYHQIKGDLAWLLSFWSARLTMSAAYSTSSQDGQLLAPTLSQGVIGDIDLALWNTTEALSQKRADARINQAFVQGEFTGRPTRDFSFGLKFRFVDQQNKTDYEAFNPLTGEYGYLALDGGLAGTIGDRIFDPDQPGDRVRIRNMPFAKDEVELKAYGDYRIDAKTKIGLAFVHSEEDYAFRERDDVNDDRVRLELSSRGLSWASLRLAYEYAKRDGGTYNPNPYEPFYSSSLGAFIPRFGADSAPHTLADLRKYDLSDRDQHVIDAQVRFTIGTRADLAVSGQYEKDDFDAEYGLREQKSASLNGELTYQISPGSSVYLYYAYQAHDRSAANINDAGPASPDGSAGGPVYPLDNAWEEFVDEDNHAVGAGYSKRWDKVSLELDYSFTYARSRIDYEFASSGAFLDLFTIEEVGSGFPAQTFKRHLVRGNVRWAILDNVTARLLYRFEDEQIDDFHYQGLDSPVVANQLYLLANPEDFRAHILGTFLEVSF